MFAKTSSLSWLNSYIQFWSPQLKKKKKKYVQKTKGGELSFLNKKSSKNSTFRTKMFALKRRLG